jgi:hypothetical protein
MSRFFITKHGWNGMICEENKKLSPYTNGTTLIQLLTAGLCITNAAKNFTKGQTNEQRPGILILLF